MDSLLSFLRLAHSSFLSRKDRCRTGTQMDLRLENSHKQVCLCTHTVYKYSSKMLRSWLLCRIESHSGKVKRHLDSFETDHAGRPPAPDCNPRRESGGTDCASANRIGNNIHTESLGHGWASQQHRVRRLLQGIIHLY